MADRQADTEQVNCPDVFDYPIATRTDQYDRMAESLGALVVAADQVEDWTGIYLPPTRVVLVGRFPAHDEPMGCRS